MEFSRQGSWSGLPYPPPWDLPNPRIEARSPTLQVDSFLSEPPGKPTSAVKLFLSKINFWGVLNITREGDKWHSSTHHNLLFHCLSGFYFCHIVRPRMNLPTIQETRVWSSGLEDPLEKEVATHPVFLPGKCHGQRSLGDYSPWAHKLLEMTE